MIELLRTDRLVFKVWEPKDAEAFILLCKKPGVSEFSSPTYQNVDLKKALDFIQKETKKFIDSRAAKFAVFFKDTPELIGICGIFEMEGPYQGCFEINYRFCSDYWGKGIGSEAAKAMVKYGFEELGLGHIYAVVRIENFRSEKVLKKIGMSVQSDIQWKGFPAKLWSISR